MILTTTHLKPSQVLRLDRYMGTYDGAVAWLACNGPEDLRADTAYLLVADVFGAEPEQVLHDAREARKRDAKKPSTSVKHARTHGPGHPTGGRVRA